MAPKRMEICGAEGILANLAFLKLRYVIHVLIVYICSYSVKNKWLPYPC